MDAWRHSKRFRILPIVCLGIVAIGSFWIVACSTSQPTVSTDTLGVYAVPQGKYLCLEYWLEVPGSGYLDYPHYSYVAGTLQGNLDPLPDWNTVKGFIGYGASLKQGKGAYSFLEEINHFPFTISVQYEIPQVLNYEVSSPTIVIEAVEANGKITISADKQFRVLSVGESWDFQVEDDNNGGSISHRLTNYGLLDRDQVTLH